MPPPIGLALTSPRRCSVRRTDSLAERAGMRAGDWVQATSSDGAAWDELRSLPELRWQLTRALSNGEPLYLSLTDRAGHARRSVLLDTGSLHSMELDAKLMRRIGLGGPFSEPVFSQPLPVSVSSLSIFS